MLTEDGDMVSCSATDSHIILLLYISTYTLWPVCGTWEAGGFVLAKTSNKSDKLATIIQRF